MSVKSTIGIDIDDTIFDHFLALADWYNARYETQLTLANNHPEGEAALGAWNATSIEQAVRRVHDFYTTVEFLDATPYDHALEVIPKLAQQYRLVFITARDSDVLEHATRNWLGAHFAGLYDDVYFTGQYSLTGKRRTKLSVCIEQDVRYLIDDNMKNCLEVASSGRQALLYGTYPWNETELELPERVVRVKNWLEVETYFAKQ